MRVLIVASYNKGSFVPFVHEQAESLKRTGVEVDMFGVTGSGARGYLLCLPALRRKIAHYRPDIVHAHYGLSALFANLQRGVPVVSTYHGSDIHSGGYLLKLSRIAMRLSAYNIFVSDNIWRMSGYQRDNSMILPCGIDLDTFRPVDKAIARRQLGWTAGDRRILFAGAFDNDVKNAPLALEVAERVGDCELVELRGYSRDQVNLLMNASDALLLTSRNEASPMVIKEAMACGCPIVSVDVGDVRQAIGGTDGCYVCDRDVEQLVTATHSAIDFGKKTAGRERIEQLSLQNVAQQLVEIYNHVKSQG